jgi:hypothetical protein
VSSRRRQPVQKLSADSADAGTCESADAATCERGERSGRTDAAI